jgi:hypothetical protein
LYRPVSQRGNERKKMRTPQSLPSLAMIGRDRRSGKSEIYINTYLAPRRTSPLLDNHRLCK